MGGGSSTPAREEDNDIDFNETPIDVPIPPDPVVGSIDRNISENVEGATAISVEDVKSVSKSKTLQFKKIVLNIPFR